MAVVKRTRQTIFDNMKSYLQTLSSNQLTDYNPGSVLTTILDAIAAELENVYNENYEVYEANYVTTAEGSDLDNKASDFGITRNEATYSTGYITFGRTTVSSSSFTIPIGTVVSTAATSTTASIDFETTAASVLTAGSLTVRIPAKCRTAGILGNVEEGAVTIMASSPTGIEYATNPSSFTGGNDEETDEELRDRIPDYLNSLARGTKDAVEAAAKDVSGVVTANVSENDPTAGYITVRIGDSSGTANAALLQEVQTQIDLYKPIGVIAEAVAAIPHYIDISCYFYPSTGYSFSEVSLDIQDAVRNFLNNKISGDDVYRSEIIDVIAEVDGVEKIDTSTGTLEEDESATCEITRIQSESSLMTDKTHVDVDNAVYNVVGVYLSSDTSRATNYYSSHNNEKTITTDAVPIENESHLSDSTVQITTDYTINDVIGVYTNTNKTGLNYYLPSGSANGTTIVLGTPLNSAGTQVYVTYEESGIGSHTNTAVTVDYYKQYVTVDNNVTDVKGVYAASDTDKASTNYYINGSYSNAVITLGHTLNTQDAQVIVDYYHGSSCLGLKPYYDTSVSTTRVARLGSITINKLSS